MNELDNTIKWEWRWVRLNHGFSISINWIAWIARFSLLVLAFYQIELGKIDKIETWVIFGITVFSMLNVALPLLSMNFKFQQRFELHDRNARGYTGIKRELLANTITLEEAIRRFTDIYKQSPEEIIRRTP